MRTGAGWAAISITSLSAISCGHAAVAPKAETANVAAIAVPKTTVAAVDVLPKAPSNLMSTIVVRSPAKLLKSARNLTGPGGDVDGLMTKLNIASALTRVDMDAPFFVVVGNDGDAVGSIGLAKDGVHAIAQALGLVKGGDGDYHEDDSDNGDKDDKNTGDDAAKPAKRTCMIATAKSRLVCGTSNQAIAAMSPYLLQTLPRAEIPADVHIEVVSGAFDKGLEAFKAKAAASGDSQNGSDKATTEGVAAAAQLFRGIEAIDLDASLGDDGVDAKIIVHVAENAESPFLRLFVAHPSQVLGAPAAYARMPADADTTWFGNGMDRDDLEPIRKKIFEVAEEAIDKDDDCPPLSAMLKKDMHALLLNGTPYVIAAGFDEERGGNAVQKLGAHPSLAAQMSARRAMEGWWIFESDDPPEPILAAVRELQAADKNEAKMCPKKKDAPKKEDAKKENSKASEGAVPKSFPKGTIHLINRSTPKKKDGPIAHEEHIFFVPDGQHTWIGYSEDEASLVKKMEVALSSAPPGTKSPTLTPLAMFSREPIALGGYLTLAGIMSAMAPNETLDELHRAVKDFAKLGSVPSKGRAVIPFTVSATPRTISLHALFSDLGLSDFAALP